MSTMYRMDLMLKPRQDLELMWSQMPDAATFTIVMLRLRSPESEPETPEWQSQCQVINITQVWDLPLLFPPLHLGAIVYVSEWLPQTSL